MCQVSDKMDSNLYEIIEIRKFGNYVPFEYKISCHDVFGGHFVNLAKK
jgi:hypothetical protein